MQKIILTIICIAAVILLSIYLLSDRNIDSNPSESAGQWVEGGGDLGVGKITEWRSASYEDRLATCGQAIMAYLTDDRNVDWDRLRKMAVTLESRVSERVSDGKLDSAYFYGISSQVLLEMGVLRNLGDKFVIDLGN